MTVHEAAPASIPATTLEAGDIAQVHDVAGEYPFAGSRYILKAQSGGLVFGGSEPASYRTNRELGDYYVARMPKGFTLTLEVV